MTNTDTDRNLLFRQSQRKVSSGRITIRGLLSFFLFISVFANLAWFIFGPSAAEPLTGHNGAIIALALIQFYLAFKI